MPSPFFKQMNWQQNITKIISEIKEENKKRTPELYNECESCLNEVMMIDHSLENIKSKEGEDVQNEIKNLTIMKYKYQIRPFILVLQMKNKVNDNVFESLFYLIANLDLEKEMVITLIEILIKHLNYGRENAAIIIKLFPHLIKYKFIYGEILINTFYSLIAFVDNNQNKKISGVKGVCMQIVLNIFNRFKNEYISSQENHVESEQLQIYKNDCRSILNDILEVFMNKTNIVNRALMLEYIELALNYQEIFTCEHIREIYVKIIAQIENIDKNGGMEDKVNKVIFQIIKSKIFIEESNKLILKSDSIVHLFEYDLFVFIIYNLDIKNAFMEVIGRMMTEKNIPLKNKQILIYNIKNYSIKIMNELENTEKSNEYESDFFLFYVKIVLDFLNSNENDNEFDKKLLEIVSFVLPKTVHHQNIFASYVQFMLSRNQKYVHACTEIFCETREYLRTDWKLLFEYFNYNLDNANFQMLLEKSIEFNSIELFNLLTSIEKTEVLKLFVIKNIFKISYNLSTLISILRSKYNDIDFLNFIILEYVKALSDIDKEIEILPFIFLLHRLRGDDIEIVFSTNKQLNCFKEYLFRINLYDPKYQTSNEIQGPNLTEKQSILNTLLEIIKLLNDKLNHSWELTFKILKSALTEKELTSISFHILQLMAEEYFLLIPFNCKIAIINMSYHINNCNIDDLNLTLQIFSVLNDLSKFIINEPEQFEIWKEFLTCILNIIKKENESWNDVFEAGLGLIFDFLLAENKLPDDLKDSYYKLIYEEIMTEILILKKNVFLNKFVSNTNISYEEKRRYKDTLIMILQKINLFNKKMGSNPFAYTFLDEYYRYIEFLFCYKFNLHELGYGTWKNDFANQCLNALSTTNEYRNIYIHILENIPIHLAENDNNEKNMELYYDVSVYVSLFGLFSKELCLEQYLSVISRFFMINNDEFREKLFKTINEFGANLTILKFYSDWLKCDDYNLVHKVLDNIKMFLNNFNDENNNSKLKTTSDSNLEDTKNDLDKIEITQDTRKPNLREKKKKTPQINFNNETKEKNNDNETLIKLMKNLTIMVKKENYFDKILQCLSLIILKFKYNKEIVEHFIEFVKFICVDDVTEQVYSSKITIYNALNRYNTSKNALEERKKEKMLIDFIETYSYIINYHLFNVKENNEKEEDKKFIDNSFSVINALSNIKIGNYRENLSFKCIEILFRFSRFTKDLLIVKIKNDCEKYVQDVKIFGESYPRVKRNEIYMILENLTKNLCLVKDVKNDLIDCLSTRDFYVIEKIKECLKNGL